MDVIYQQTNEPFVDFAKNICAHNLQKIETLPVIADLRMVENMLNDLYKIASIYIPMAVYFVNYESGLFQILLSVFHKNIFAFYSVIELTKEGLYGPARSMLRYVYEGLLIAKYCSVNPESSLIEKWSNGLYINLSREVLGKISSPDIQPLKEFWKMLHSYVHSTKYSQQVSLNLDENLYEIELNLVFIKILLECCYHLLNSHIITPSVVYYAKLYGEHDKGKMIKKELSSLFTESKRAMQNQPRKIIYTYKRSWLVKP